MILWVSGRRLVRARRKCPAARDEAKRRRRRLLLDLEHCLCHGGVAVSRPFSAAVPLLVKATIPSPLCPPPLHLGHLVHLVHLVHLLHFVQLVHLVHCSMRLAVSCRLQLVQGHKLLCPLGRTSVSTSARTSAVRSALAYPKFTADLDFPT